MKQRLMGLTLTLCGLLSVPIEWDATVAIVVVPLGLYILFTREKVVY